jgi:hypothetical protein
MDRGRIISDSDHDTYISQCAHVICAAMSFNIYMYKKRCAVTFSSAIIVQWTGDGNRFEQNSRYFSGKFSLFNALLTAFRSRIYPVPV